LLRQKRMAEKEGTENANTEREKEVQSKPDCLEKQIVEPVEKEKAQLSLKPVEEPTPPLVKLDS
jgi:hypothetical protein